MSLSLSNVSKFYMNYVKENYDKVRSELNRIGYFTLKNKVYIGDNYSNTKDVFNSMYLMNMEMEYECSRIIQQNIVALLILNL